MSYCSRCGVQIGDGERLCQACKAGDPANVYKPSSRAASDIADARDNKTMGIMAYCSFLVVIPAFTAKESPFARYHANQGLVLAIMELAYGIISNIISSAASSAMLRSGAWLRTGSWGVWSLVTMLLGLFWIVFGILSIIGIRNAMNGRCKPLPIIGGIKILK